MPLLRSAWSKIHSEALYTSEKAIPTPASYQAIALEAVTSGALSWEVGQHFHALINTKTIWTSRRRRIISYDAIFRDDASSTPN